METKVKAKEKRYILEGRAPLSFLLQARDMPTSRLLYFDEKKGKNRSLRYSKNQQSPFVDEQDENVVLEPIVFEDGVLTVPANNPVLQQFLEIHPLNGDVFKEWDPAAEAEAYVKHENLVLDAQIKAREISVEKKITIINIFLGKDASMWEKSEITRAVMNIAKSQPDDFLDALDNPDTDIEDLAIRSMKDGYVSQRNNGRDFHYNLKDNKKRMFSVPFEDDPIKCYVSWLKSPEGYEFYQYLDKNIEE
jgi:hypothetical protein